MRLTLALSFLLLSIGLNTAMAQENLDQLSPGSDAQDRTIVFNSNNEVSIEQVGSDNIAEVTSDSDSSVLVIQQTGAEQSALVRLSGEGNRGGLEQAGAGNIANLEVDGTLNVFNISQSGAVGTDVTGNEVVLQQLGFGNVALQVQNGFGNRMTLRQNGDDNVAELLQDGIRNLMELEQNGNANEAFLTQKGTEAPPIIITQSGGMRVEITQTGTD